MLTDTVNMEEKELPWSRGNMIAVLDSDTGTQGFSAFASSTYSTEDGTAIALIANGYGNIPLVNPERLLISHDRHETI